MGSLFNDKCSVTQRFTERVHLKLEAETGVMQSLAKECQWLPITTRNY